VYTWLMRTPPVAGTALVVTVTVLELPLVPPAFTARTR